VHDEDRGGLLQLEGDAEVEVAAVVEEGADDIGVAQCGGERSSFRSLPTDGRLVGVEPRVFVKGARDDGVAAVEAGRIDIVGNFRDEGGTMLAGRDERVVAERDGFEPLRLAGAVDANGIAAAERGEGAGGRAGGFEDIDLAADRDDIGETVVIDRHAEAVALVDDACAGGFDHKAMRPLSSLGGDVAAAEIQTHRVRDRKIGGGDGFDHRAGVEAEADRPGVEAEVAVESLAAEGAGGEAIGFEHFD
jgi:hypothetical protein